MAQKVTIRADASARSVHCRDTRTCRTRVYTFIRARSAVPETNLPARRRTVISAEAILDEEASLHAERNVLTHEQHVAIQHLMDTHGSASHALANIRRRADPPKS